MKKLSFVLAMFFSLVLAICSYAQAPNWDWSRNSRGLNGRSQSYQTAIATDRSNNIYTTGYFRDSIAIGGDSLYGGSLETAYLLKHDSSGNLIWSRQNLYNNITDAYFRSVVTDNSGCVYVLGSFNNNPFVIGTDTLINDSVGYSMFLLKYDSSGNILWARNSMGSSTDYSLDIDSSGHLYIVGQFYSSVISFNGTVLVNDTTRGRSCVYIVKYDTSGNVIWAKTSSAGSGYFYSVTAAENGSVYVTGNFSSPYLRFGTTVLTNVNPLFAYGDLFLLKYDTSGNLIWANSINGTYGEMGNKVIADGLGSVYLTGYFTSDTINFGAHYLLKDSLVTAANSLFLAKYDSSGYNLWAKGVHATNCKATSATFDRYKRPCITGSFLNNNTIIGVDTFINPGFFIAQYDTAGSVLWVKGLETRRIFPNTITTDSYYNICFGGSSTDTVTIGPDTLLGTGTYYYDIFLGKLTYPASLGISNLIKPEPIKAYPIPTNGILNISLGVGNYIALNMYDATGKKVYSKALDVKTNEFQLNTAGFANGVYIIHALRNDGVNYQRVVIQH